MTAFEPHSDPILRTKLSIPSTRAEWVPRPHLLARLNESLKPGRKLVLISAPAGYGKTSLLSLWARDLISEGRRVAWLSLSEGERDPARFLGYVAAALELCGIEILWDPNALRGSPQGRAMQQGLVTLLNEIVAGMPGPAGRLNGTGDLILILDDYHTVAIPTVDAALAFLLDNLPLEMRLVIATRLDPSLPLARLRARGEMTELRAADLAFSVAETGQLLTGAGLAATPPGAVDHLHARTEGWAAGLHLFALSLRDRRDPARLVADLAGTHRYIADYLLSEVLDQQPAHVQRFLIQTSILDPMCAALCDRVVASPTERMERADAGAILGAPDVPARGASARQMLTYLDAANLFVLAVDEDRVWYRYHQLFRDLLQGRLARQAPTLRSTLHQRASRWYETEGMAAPAIEHALLAQESDRAAALIAAYGGSAIIRGETNTLLRWLAELPDATRLAAPILDVWQGAALLFTGRSSGEIQACLARAISGDPEPRVAGGAGIILAMMSLLQGDTATAIERTEAALLLLPQQESFLYVVGTSNLGLARMVTGDLEAATRAFEELVPLVQRVSHDGATSRALELAAIAASPLANLAGVLMIQGSLQRAAALDRQVLAIAVDARGRLIPAAGKALMGLGEIEREWDHLEAAAEHLEAGIALTRRSIEMGTVVGYVSLMAVRHAQGDADAARTALATAREIAARSDVTDLDDRLVAAFEVWLAALQGDRAAARHWIATHQAGAGAAAAPSRVNAEFHEMEQLALARAHLVLDEPEPALRVLAPLAAAARQRRRMRRVMEIWTLQVLALQAQGEISAALSILAQALEFGESEGFVRVFVDAGEPMARMLYAAIEHKISQRYAGHLLTHFRGLDDVAGGRSPVARAALIEPLSDRELDVLALIAEGLTNQEIARRLVIVLSTVKGHTSNIYGKLGVRNRTQAVAKARALGLLPPT